MTRTHPVSRITHLKTPGLFCESLTVFMITRNYPVNIRTTMIRSHTHTHTPHTHVRHTQLTFASPVPNASLYTTVHTQTWKFQHSYAG